MTALRVPSTPDIFIRMTNWIAAPPDQPGETARGAATRQRLLAATVELVAEHGWDGVTTRQIAERANANQASIGYHFGSKEQLLRTAVDVALREVFTAPVQAMLAAPTLVEGTVGLLRGFVGLSQADRVVRFSMEAMSRAVRDDAVREVMAGLLAELRSQMADGIVEAQRRGELSPAVDSEGTAAVLGALFDGLGLHLMIDPSLKLERVEPAIRALLRPHPEER